MKQIRTILLISLLLILGIAACQSINNFRTASSGEFADQTNPVPTCQAAMFDKSAVVFDAILICGTNAVPADKLTHAANVAAEWLDNDEDGQVDEPRLLETLKTNKPILLMSGNGFNNTAMDSLMNTFSDYRAQDLYASETNPGGGERDASQEEIHHLIINAGWQSLFPTVFSESASDNSDLYQAWKFADENSYYVYNDPTCDDSCKVTEFVYLATAAYMEKGTEADLASDEMRLKTRSALSETIPAVIQIFESADYAYPTNHWPDGTYPHQEHITMEGAN